MLFFGACEEARRFLWYKEGGRGKFQTFAPTAASKFYCNLSQ
jgi:hypothetical protein